MDVAIVNNDIFVTKTCKVHDNDDNILVNPEKSHTNKKQQIPRFDFKFQYHSKPKFRPNHNTEEKEADEDCHELQLEQSATEEAESLLDISEKVQGQNFDTTSKNSQKLGYCSNNIKDELTNELSNARLTLIEKLDESESIIYEMTNNNNSNVRQCTGGKGNKNKKKSGSGGRKQRKHSQKDDDEDNLLHDNNNNSGTAADHNVKTNGKNISYPISNDSNGNNNYNEKKHDISRQTIIVNETTSLQNNNILSLSFQQVIILCCFIRIINVFCISSHFVADEYWQTLEPAYCSIFLNDDEPCQGHTWEWRQRAPTDIMNHNMNIIEKSKYGPIRSYLSVIPVHIFYLILKTLHIDTHWLVSKGPMILNALIVAVPIDISVWYTGRWLNNNNNNNNNGQSLANWCLFISLTSWFGAYTYVRTLANSQEALLLIIAIAIMSPELIGNVKTVRYYKIRACIAFLLGGLSLAIRFTAIVAFVPLGIILALRNATIVEKITFLFFPCAIMGLTGIAFSLIVDRWYYTFWTIPFIGNLHFNVILHLSDLYGINVWYWYLSAGLPTLASSLLPFTIYDFGCFITRKDIDYGKRNLWIIFLSYLIILSVSSHKEFRFIVPLLPLLCIISASSVRSVMSNRKWLVGLWIIANLITLMYLGLFHQSGAISINHKIIELAEKQVNMGLSSSLVAADDNTTCTNTTATSISVHYLTGGCHPTPLLSYLHSRKIQNVIQTKHLDCSPSCLGSETEICEKDVFANDPIGYMNQMYCTSNNDNNVNRNYFWNSPRNDGVCIEDSTSRPDYVVTFSEYVPIIHNILNDRLGMVEVARFPYLIQGVKIFDNQTIGNMNIHRNFHIFPGLLEVSLEQMVLFAKKSIIEEKVVEPE